MADRPRGATGEPEQVCVLGRVGVCVRPDTPEVPVLMLALCHPAEGLSPQQLSYPSQGRKHAGSPNMSGEDPYVM